MVVAAVDSELPAVAAYFSELSPLITSDTRLSGLAASSGVKPAVVFAAVKPIATLVVAMEPATLAAVLETAALAAALGPVAMGPAVLAAVLETAALAAALGPVALEAAACDFDSRSDFDCIAGGC